MSKGVIKIRLIQNYNPAKLFVPSRYDDDKGHRDDSRPVGYETIATKGTKGTALTVWNTISDHGQDRKDSVDGRVHVASCPH